MTVREWPSGLLPTEIEPRSAQRGEFCEAGSHESHDALDVCVRASVLEFETDYAVAPGTRLSFAAIPRYGDPELDEVGVEVLRVDSRPGNRFRVSGRLQRHR